jgi:hypothetical protein
MTDFLIGAIAGALGVILTIAAIVGVIAWLARPITPKRWEP